MAGGLYAIATQLAVLASARLPEWAESLRTAILTALPSGSDGLALQQRVATHVACDLRLNPSGRTIRYRVTTLDLTATYGISLDGTAASYDAGAGSAADLGDVLDGLAAAISGGAAAVTVATDESVGEVLIRSTSAEGIAVTAVSATGSAVVVCEAEPRLADLEVWAQSTGLDGWRRILVEAVDRKGLYRLLPTPGLSRVALRVTNLAGHPNDASAVSLVVYRAAIGPAKVEPAA